MKKRLALVILAGCGLYVAASDFHSHVPHKCHRSRKDPDGKCEHSRSRLKLGLGPADDPAEGCICLTDCLPLFDLQNLKVYLATRF